MKVYNQDKTKILDDYDLSKGYLVSDRIVVAHYEAQQEVKEVSHIEIVAEYPNGGKDIEVVVDVPYQPYRKAYDEYEDIKVYIPFSVEQLKTIRINELKQLLEDSDYKVLKYAEGELSEEEFLQAREQRRAWRAEINRLEI